MKKKTYFLAIMVFSIGVLMLMGSSYSLIVNNITSNETYGFNVANFNVEFTDNTKISISGIPMDDKDGMAKSREFTFTVANNSDYDVNYRLDIIENSVVKMDEVIHYAYSLNDSPYSNVLSLKDYFTINQNQVLKVNNIDTYKVKMWLSIDADENYMNKMFSASIMLSATQNDSKYASSVIEKLALNNQDGVKKIGDDYRYNSSSNNYLWFNCQDGFTRGEDYCEKWQIIGSFKNKSEKALQEYPSLKIVSTKIYEEVPFNNEDQNGNYNNSYIASFANGAYYDKLNNDAKKLILKGKWHIGNINSDNYNEVLSKEKENVFYGYVGLINVSDYLFLKDNVFFNKENIMLLNKKNNNVMVLNDTLNEGNNLSLYSFLPCIYLRSDVSIISGDGSINNPYEITIKYPMNYLNN